MSQTTLLDLLAESGAISATVLAQLHAYMARWGTTPLAAVLETHVLPEAQLADEIAERLKISRIYQVAAHPFQKDALHAMPYELAKKWVCFPLGTQGTKSDAFEVVMADPLAAGAVEDLEKALKRQLVLAVGERSDIVRAIDSLYPSHMEIGTS